MRMIDYTDICPIFLNKDDNTFLRKHWRKKRNILGKVIEDVIENYPLKYTLRNEDGTAKTVTVVYEIKKAYLTWLHRWIPWAPSWFRPFKRLSIVLRRKKIGVMYFYEPTGEELKNADDGSIIRIRPTHIKDASDRILYTKMDPFTFKEVADSKQYTLMRKSLREWVRASRWWYAAIIILAVVIVVMLYYNGYLGYYGPPRP